MNKPVYDLSDADDEVTNSGRRAASPGYGAPVSVPNSVDTAAFPSSSLDGFTLPEGAYPLPVATPTVPQASFPPPSAAASFPPPSAAASFPPPSAAFPPPAATGLFAAPTSSAQPGTTYPPPSAAEITAPTTTQSFPPPLASPQALSAGQAAQADGKPTSRRSAQQQLPSQLPPPSGAQVLGLAALPAEDVAASPVQLLSDLSPSVGSGQAGSDPELVAALNAVITSKGSDLHVSVNAPPSIRVDGALKAIPGVPPWDADKVNSALESILTPELKKKFEENLELDFAYTLSETSRFRVNFYMQRNVMGAAFRLIPTEIKQLSALGVPARIGDFSKLARGLVLVTGPTGSGKSTTLAALVDLVNSTRSDHIVTVEDPIEFIHGNKKSLVNQREVGHDTHSFANALKHVLRQDPDVILIGELRDLETISVALTAAETGHLVFATLHTQDAAQTIDRVIDVFPPHQQGQVRAQLAATLQGVVCQTLVKKASGRGRVVATEVLVINPAISNLIREGKTYQIHSALQAGRDLGMFTMDQHLADLVDAGKITHEAAIEKAHDVEALMQMINRANPGADGRGVMDDLDFGDKFSTPAAG